MLSRIEQSSLGKVRSPLRMLTERPMAAPAANVERGTHTSDVEAEPHVDRLSEEAES
jgi:hypothetical protein